MKYDIEKKHSAIKEEKAVLEMAELKGRNTKLFEALRIKTKRSHELDIQVKVLEK